ncbi:MAG: hypothetical protein II219_00910, partial [Alphaproteobacteria bacterium]|nr:hypothetical protein [Alphaproteobacteria bacterium]
GGYIPEKSYLFADAFAKPSVGDLAVCIDADFDEIDADTSVNAQIVSVRQASQGKVYGQISGPEEKITGKTMHKIIMIVME